MAKKNQISVLGLVGAVAGPLLGVLAIGAVAAFVSNGSEKPSTDAQSARMARKEVDKVLQMAKDAAENRGDDRFEKLYGYLHAQHSNFSSHELSRALQAENLRQAKRDGYTQLENSLNIFIATNFDQAPLPYLEEQS